jgi:hypothetical protein
VYLGVHTPQRVVDVLLHGGREVGEDRAEARGAISAAAC